MINGKLYNVKEFCRSRNPGVKEKRERRMNNIWYMDSYIREKEDLIKKNKTARPIQRWNSILSRKETKIRRGHMKYTAKQTKTYRVSRTWNIKELYKFTKNDAQKTNNSIVLKDQHGSIFSKNSDIVKKWAEHFRSVLSRRYAY